MGDVRNSLVLCPLMLSMLSHQVQITAHEQGAGLAYGCVHLYFKPAEHDVLSMLSI